jgi:hypothetical protein
VRVRAEPLARLDYIIIQDAERPETDIVGIAVFGEGKMKMAVQPAVPSPPHLFAVNVLNHKNLLFYIVNIPITDFKPPVIQLPCKDTAFFVLQAKAADK